MLMFENFANNTNAKYHMLEEKSDVKHRNSILFSSEKHQNGLPTLITFMIHIFMRDIFLFSILDFFLHCTSIQTHNNKNVIHQSYKSSLRQIFHIAQQNILYVFRIPLVVELSFGQFYQLWGFAKINIYYESKNYNFWLKMEFLLYLRDKYLCFIDVLGIKLQRNFDLI